MAPLDQAEKDQLSAQILQELSQTRYACSSLTPLSGGTANFVFRGILTQPFSLPQEDGIPTTTESVVVKHTTAFASVNRDFPLHVSRCVKTLSYAPSLP